MATKVNNDIYFDLGDRWYEANDDPVALLRALARLHAPWIDERLPRDARVLDVGCGAGLIANPLAERGHAVVGIDNATPALEVARRHDRTGRVRWVTGDACALPFDDASFDGAIAMDFLEHVERPDVVVAEIARVLRPGGRFFFHTFDRNPLAWLVAIKGVEWFVRNVPPRMHTLRLFVRPSELRAYCEEVGLGVESLHGCAPVLSRAFIRMLASRVVPPDFAFHFVRSTAISYSGFAVRAPSDFRNGNGPLRATR